MRYQYLLCATLVFGSALAGSAQPPLPQQGPPQVVFNPYHPTITVKPLQYSPRPVLSPYLYLSGAGGDPAVNYQLFVVPAMQQRNLQLRPQIGSAPYDPNLQQQFQDQVTPLAQTGRPTGFLFNQGYNDKLLPGYRYIPYNPSIMRFPGSIGP